MKRGENFLIVKMPSINLENEINWSKKTRKWKKERSYGSMNHGDIYDLILMMFDNLIWRLDFTFNTRFAVYKSNLVIQGHHWIKKNQTLLMVMFTDAFLRKKNVPEFF